MQVTVESLAFAPARQPWAAPLLALAASGGQLELERAENVPEALRMLRSLDRCGFDVDGDGLMSSGSWEFSVGPPGHLLPPGFDPSHCWTIAGDAGSYALVARWGDDLSNVELFQVWIRDELDHHSLGALDGVLETLVRALLAPETCDGELNVELDDAAMKSSLIALLAEAQALRAKEREARQEQLRSVESRIDAGEEDARLIADWESAQVALERLAIARWEHLAQR
jgi:hypothetical protein